MEPLEVFVVSIVLSTACSAILGRAHLWPKIRALDRSEALRPLLLVHGFRFVGLSFLVPGVRPAELPAAFTGPVAYGDLAAAVLALAALAAVTWRWTGTAPLLWLFSLVGVADLIYALYLGSVHIGDEPGLLGPLFFIPTVVVPFLLMTHVLILVLMFRSGGGARSDET